MGKGVLRYALLNAVEFNGKAEVQAVLGKLIADNPEMKSKIKEIIPLIKRTVNEVNSLTLNEQKKKIEELGIKAKEEKKFEIGLPDLPNARMGKTVMRLAPFPSGPLHIGNARMVILNDEYTKKYKGKLLLIIDDTIGSEEKSILPEAYEMILDGLKWLNVKYHKIFYKSDRLNYFYKFAEELIKRNLAYMCECDVETLRKNRAEGIACKHKSQDSKENLKLWKEMLKGKYKEGEAVLRLKTDTKDPNPAFRDRVLLRVVGRKHPKVGNKYKIWPLLEFSWAVDDHLLGMTHILRGKDLVIEDMMEKYIWQKMGWNHTAFIHYGLLNIQEAKLSKSEARKSIKSGIYSGWDDPRTWSLQALKKRGIQPDAIRKFIISMGLSEADVTIPAEILYSENRKLIDSKANRFFAVLEPVKIKVNGAPKIKEAEGLLHPDFPKRGKRKLPVNLEKIYVEKNDLKKFKNQEIGLINLFSIKTDVDSKFTSNEIKFESQKIHWVSEPNVKVKIVMPDGNVKEAIGEINMKKLKEDDLIQLVRIGFCRVDKVNKDIVLYYAHK
jgi:glutamyl-tRNA synthetase